MVTVHPVFYQVPLWSKLGKSPHVELTVYYCGHFFDEWKTPLLDGYRYKFLYNLRKNDPPSGFFRRINPGLIPALVRHRNDAVIIHGFDNVSAWIAFLTAKLIRTPVIFRGESTMQGFRPGWRQYVKRLVLPLLYHSMDAVLYSCQGNKKVFQYYRVPDHKLFFLACAVDNEHLQQERARLLDHVADIRREMGIALDRFVVLYLARVIERKRHVDLLHALKLLIDQGIQNVDVVIVGDGPEIGALHQLTAQLGLQDHVHLVGFVSQADIGRYCIIANMGVTISDWDNSPKAVNEMMNFGLPILCTNVIGTAGNLVQDGVNGYIVDVGDIHVIAQRIQMLAVDPDLTHRMSQKALEAVLEWSFQQNVETVQQALASIKARQKK